MDITLAEMIKRANDVKQEIKIVLENSGQQMIDVPFADYPDKIRNAIGAGSGSTVTFVPELLSGTKIGTIYINGTGVEMYCVDSSGLEEQLKQKAPIIHRHNISDVDNLEVILQSKAENNLASEIADGLMSISDKIKLDSITPGASNVIVTRDYDIGTKIGSITVNGVTTDLYCESTYMVNEKLNQYLYSLAKYSEIDSIFDE